MSQLTGPSAVTPKDLYEIFAEALGVKRKFNIFSFVVRAMQDRQVWAKDDFIADFLSSVSAELYSDKPLSFLRIESGMQRKLNAEANKIRCLEEQKKQEEERLKREFIPRIRDVLGVYLTSHLPKDIAVAIEDEWFVSQLSSEQRIFMEEFVVGVSVVEYYSEQIALVAEQIECFGEWILSAEYGVLKENYDSFRSQRSKIHTAWVIS